MSRSPLPAVILAGLLVLSACGMSGMDHNDELAAAGGTVEIAMVDTAFEPASLEVEAGETVEFIFRNDGKLPHDAFIGDPDAQANHERDMREAADSPHGGGHANTDEPEGAITVEPGEEGELVYTFDAVGVLEVGCHQPGHYQAGMRIGVTVV